MRISKIVGTVTLSRCHPSFEGANLKLAIPQNLENMLDLKTKDADSLVVWDQIGAGNGTLIATAEGPEASQPFRPELKPVDAYAAAILDTVDVDDKLGKELLE